MLVAYGSSQHGARRTRGSFVATVPACGLPVTRAARRFVYVDGRGLVQPVTVAPERSEGGSGDWHPQRDLNPCYRDENPAS